MLSTLIARVPLSSEVLNFGLPMSLECVGRRRLDSLPFDPARVALRGGCGLGRADEDERDTDGEHASEHWGLLLLIFFVAPARDHSILEHVCWGANSARANGTDHAPARCPKADIRSAANCTPLRV